MADTVHRMSSDRFLLQQPGGGIIQRSPSIEFEESDHEYKVIIEMLEGEEVELNTEISNGVLSVSGKVKSSFSDKGEKLL